VKNARLLAEFREIDSYLTGSEDEGYEELEDARPTLAQKEFDNSILRMARSLLAAAKANPIEGTTEVPRVTLRLTRLDPSPSNGEVNDPRILKTIQCLQDMGVDVELGERRSEDLPASAKVTPSPAPPVPLEPTIHVNIDLSVLIALISDLTHAPLPKTVEEASQRFIPPQAYREWKKKKNGLFGKKKIKSKGFAAEPLDSEGVEMDAGDIPSDLVKHSCALTNQLLQEMGKGLLQEIHDRISILALVACGAAKVKFWTTIEARDRCLRIISKIGGPSEKRRAHAIFHSVSSILPDELSSVQAEELYWQDSRYALRFLPLFPMNLFPSSGESDATLVLEARSPPLPLFLKSLARTCKDILAQETIPHPRSLRETLAKNGSHTDILDSEIQRAIVTKANPRLTAHTVQSLLWGAELGWTTLTANKTSIRAILREVKLARMAGRLDGIVEGGAEAETDNKEDKAAIWIVDPRSLAEGMSSRAG